MVLRDELAPPETGEEKVVEDDGGKKERRTIPSDSAKWEISAALGHKRAQRFFSRSFARIFHLATARPVMLSCILRCAMCTYRMCVR